MAKDRRRAVLDAPLAQVETMLRVGRARARGWDAGVRTMTGWSVRLALLPARVILWLYSPSVRQEMAAAMLADVRQRAEDDAGSFGPLGDPLRFVRLAGSLVANALASWGDVTVFHGRGRPSGARAFSCPT